jgi:hypothetical protein
MINLLRHFSPIHGIDGSGIQHPIATKDILVVDPDSFPPRASKKKKPKSGGPTENNNMVRGCSSDPYHREIFYHNIVGNQCFDEVKIEPEYLDNSGKAFWKLRSCNDE